MKNRLLAGVFALALLSAAPASAFTLSAHGGLSTGTVPGYKSSRLLFGGELTYGLGDLFQAGGFYDHNPLTADPAGGTDGSLSHYGAVARVSFGMISSLFVDAKLGFDKMSAGGFSSDSAFGFGVGAGYIIGLVPTLSLKPRVGYRSLAIKSGTTSVNRSIADLGVLLSFSF
jgi:hypothetical protein